MTEEQWADLVDRLNVGFPHQQIDELTAEVWFDTLKDYRREEVGRALARCVGGVEFISCYALVSAIKDERREAAASHSTVIPLPPRRREVPPEWTEIRKVLEHSKSLPGGPGHMLAPEARERIEELARYLDARLTEASQAPRRGGS